jgi:hypothetical protein
MHKAKIHTPFVGGNKMGATFTANHQDFGGPRDKYKPTNEDDLFRSKTSQKWNVNNPNKKGFYGTFS